MSRVEKYLNLTAVLLPFAAFIAAIALTWNSLIGWSDLVLFFGLYLVTAIGITVGYHRLFTHRAFDAPKGVKYALAIMGSMSVQGSLIDWVADHRKHHAFTDEDGDPHSPHGHGGGFKGAFKGLVYAHMGWLLETQGAADKKRFAKDLLDDPGLSKISKRFPWIVLFSLALPTVLGFLLTGTAMGALTGYIWGGLVRIFFVHHVTWSVNSVCHFFGTPPLRRRGSVDQRLLARDPVARRVMAPQPPRLPALGRARPQVVRGRPLRADHPRHGQDRLGDERRLHPARAPARPPGSRLGAEARARSGVVTCSRIAVLTSDGGAAALGLALAVRLLLGGYTVPSRLCRALRASRCSGLARRAGVIAARARVRSSR